MNLIDTHAHLTFDPLLNHIDAVMNRAVQSGVSTVLVPAYDLASWDIAERLCLRQTDSEGASKGIFMALGLHPWKSHEQLDVTLLEKRLHQPCVVAIGEIGLDFKVEKLDKVRQLEVFQMQLELAVQLDVPVMLHCRGAFVEMVDILKRYGGKVRGVVHAFSRGPEIADQFLKLGLAIAFGGAITRPNAKRARQSAIHVPLEKIVLETDCPSIGLADVAAADTEPRHVASIGGVLAALRGVSIDEIAAQTTHNAHWLFF